MNLPWLIIAILGTVSLIFTIISLATAAWIVLGSSGVGLWQTCLNSVCVSIPSFAGGWCHGCIRCKYPVKCFEKTKCFMAVVVISCYYMLRITKGWGFKSRKKHQNFGVFLYRASIQYVLIFYPNRMGSAHLEIFEIQYNIVQTEYLCTYNIFKLYLGNSKIWVFQCWNQAQTFRAFLRNP